MFSLLFSDRYRMFVDRLHCKIKIKIALVYTVDSRFKPVNRDEKRALFMRRSIEIPIALLIALDGTELL